MKKLLSAIFLFLFLSTSFTKAQTNTIDAIKQDPNEIDAIKKILMDLWKDIIILKN